MTIKLLAHHFIVFRKKSRKTSVVVKQGLTVLLGVVEGALRSLGKRNKPSYQISEDSSSAISSPDPDLTTAQEITVFALNNYVLCSR